MPSTITSVVGRTGSTCPQTGPYRSGGRGQVIVFIKKGDAFPPDVDGSSTSWTLLTAAAA